MTIKGVTYKTIMDKSSVIAIIGVTYKTKIVDIFFEMAIIDLAYKASTSGNSPKWEIFGKRIILGKFFEMTIITMTYKNYHKGHVIQNSNNGHDL